MPPNFSGSGEPLPSEGVVSLGRGGQIVLQFTNNLLTGSGNANPDLRIFEVGDSEEVLVEVSADGLRWTSRWLSLRPLLPSILMRLDSIRIAVWPSCG